MAVSAAMPEAIAFFEWVHSGSGQSFVRANSPGQVGDRIIDERAHLRVDIRLAELLPSVSCFLWSSCDYLAE
ncbi:hypothetical protein [Laspinema palackyanum]|uniref:hypothetical protein n=1 Tax=Laspinema palackyanum TaxID=3231601 RepID=UPI00345DE3CF|nr:hypothetical protein [Laspinema sp. D2c]